MVPKIRNIRASTLNLWAHAQTGLHCRIVDTCQKERLPIALRSLDLGPIQRSSIVCACSDAGVVAEEISINTCAASARSAFEHVLATEANTLLRHQVDPGIKRVASYRNPEFCFYKITFVVTNTHIRRNALRATIERNNDFRYAQESCAQNLQPKIAKCQLLAWLYCHVSGINSVMRVGILTSGNGYLSIVDLLLVAIIIVFLYYNIWILTSQVLSKGWILPPVVGAWLPNVLFGAVGVYALWRAE